MLDHEITWLQIIAMLLGTIWVGLSVEALRPWGERSLTRLGVAIFGTLIAVLLVMSGGR